MCPMSTQVLSLYMLIVIYDIFRKFKTCPIQYDGHRARRLSSLWHSATVPVQFMSSLTKGVANTLLPKKKDTISP